jgi:hypothetical protein
VLPPGENARRNEELERDMCEAGWTFRPAAGLSARPKEPWSEASFAVLDESLHEVLEVARRYHQVATYEWTPTDRAVVPTRTTNVRHRHGWFALWR